MSGLAYKQPVRLIMRYFNELTPEQQDKALKLINPEPLMRTFDAGLRALFETRMHIFDERLIPHYVSSPGGK